MNYASIVLFKLSLIKRLVLITCRSRTFLKFLQIKKANHYFGFFHEITREAILLVEFFGVNNVKL